LYIDLRGDEIMETRNEALRGKPAERGAARKPSSLEAIVALALSFGVVIVGVRLRVGMTTPLVAGTIVAGLFARYLGYRWGELQTAMMEGIMHALPAVLILMLVGMTIGIWIIGGTVPTLVYYGLKLISPRAFLAATFILCAITSIATGTSFGTIGTIGLALIGIGEGLSIPLPMVAGAIVAGAYFGDKMSPLSDTTNVAPAMAGAELFEHIGSMTYTTVPAFLVSLVIYAAIGMKFGGEAAGGETLNAMLSTLPEAFNIGLWTLVPPLVVIVLSVRRTPAILTLTAGVVISCLWAMLTQGVDLVPVLKAATDGYASKTGVAAVDKLFTRGGLNNMMGTVALIMIATALGGILERANVLSTIIDAVLAKVKSTGALILSVIISCYAVLIISGNQMLALILPGRAFKDAFDAKNIHPRVLSRTLEDAGTMAAPLVPWSTAALFTFGILKVSAWSYAPYALLNWIVPIFSIIYGYAGFAIFKKDGDKS